jgi:hypothetical protein
LPNTAKSSTLAFILMVEVQLAVYPVDKREHRIVIHAENDGERYILPPGGHTTCGSGRTGCSKQPSKY